MLPLSRFSLPVLLLLVCLSGQASAEVIKDLYEVQIPVKSQSREERFDALYEALIQVLIKVSGSTAMLANADPSTQLILQKPNNYIQQFRYRSVQTNSPGRNSAPRTELVLWIRFDEKAINTVLRERGQQVWGRTRPTALVWLIVAENGDRVLMSNQDKHPSVLNLENYARQRGLPLQFPYLDLTDRGQVSISDIWGNFEGPILQASNRYRPEAVLVGRLFRKEDNTWSARWSIYQDGRREDLDVDGEAQLESTIQPVISQTTETLAKRFAVVTNTSEEVSSDVLIEVSGIKSLVEFNKVVKYLASLTVVSKVEPYVVNGSTATFRLTTQSGRLDVAQAIDLGRVLTAQNQIQVLADGKVVKPDLVYQLKQ
ncbi:MAG: DUF2066 domain-containing protein [Gammaproteobacteria bacterium]|nr:DUF2066 domain-containing protein [Gammaproteobacteria bacterium]